MHMHARPVRKKKRKQSPNTSFCPEEYSAGEKDTCATRCTCARYWNERFKTKPICRYKAVSHASLIVGLAFLHNFLTQMLEIQMSLDKFDHKSRASICVQLNSNTNKQCILLYFVLSPFVLFIVLFRSRQTWTQLHTPERVLIFHFPR